MVVLACHPTYMGSIDRRIMVQASKSLNMRPSQKSSLKAKKVGSVFQMVVHFPSKHRVLSSNEKTSQYKTY
jgi:hypothetical protein